MRLLSFLLVLFLFFTQAHAQIKAITSTGDEVVLNENGTWKYVSKQINDSTEIPVNPKVFKKPATSSFQIKSSKLPVSVHINPKKWSFKKGDEGDAGEFAFQTKEGDAYGMLICEKIQIPIETLRNLALTNARAVAPDVHIAKQEYRTVNGIKLLMMQMDGTIQGVEFSYYGYYYSFNGGTIQLLTYTAQNLLEDYKPDLEDFLNGFEMIK